MTILHQIHDQLGCVSHDNIRYIKIPFKTSQTLQVYKCALRCPHLWKVDPPFFNHRIHLTFSRSDHTLLAPRALQQMVASLKPREAKGLIQKWLSFARRNRNLCHFSSKKKDFTKSTSVTFCSLSKRVLLLYKPGVNSMLRVMMLI